MKRLTVAIKSHFIGQEKKYGVDQIILATPDEPGEGEHKLFTHMREFPCYTGASAVYGLDADLIMLALFHLEYSKEIYVFREAPDFLRLAIDLPPEENVWFLDILKLAASITNEMACSFPSHIRMYDYVFLCFFLGNDFLPHFPALNIRTHGMQRLLDVYRMVIGNKQNCFLVDFAEKKVNWENVRDFVRVLASMEHEFIMQEYKFREKWDHKTPIKWPQTTEKEREECFQNVPVIFRADEKYIAPDLPGWEDRYYQRLLFVDNNEDGSGDSIGEATQKYLEGLEWVFLYYTSHCIDWNWHYPYNYPPLLKDLTDAIQTYSNHSHFRRNSKPISPETQLAYVLPKSQHFLLEPSHALFLEEKYGHLYPSNRSDLKFKWAFCRYFWESHICLPKLELGELFS
jgi:5'-3' exonuclease